MSVCEYVGMGVYDSMCMYVCACASVCMCVYRMCVRTNVYAYFFIVSPSAIFLSLCTRVKMADGRNRKKLLN